MEQDHKIYMYQQIVNDYKQKILSGELKPHDSIPNQSDLARLYNTSEMTSRRALSELVLEDLIYRIRSKGTFVKDQKSGIERSSKIIKPLPQLKRIYFAHPGVKMRMFTLDFYRNLLSGIQAICEENDVEFRILDLGPKFELPDEEDAGYVLITDVPTARMDYVEALQQWKKEERKMVTVQFSYPHLQIPYVIEDNLTGGYLATQHLLSLGHRRIGIILTGTSQLHLNHEFSLRLQGYKLALSLYHIDFDPELVSVVDKMYEDESMGAEGFEALMSLSEPPTAIFAVGDYKALGVINAARERSLSIPNDLSVIGYDNEMFGEHIDPGLTTIDHNTYLFGTRAAEMLLFNWKPYNAAETVVDTVVPKLIIRDSTKEYTQD
ncbi:GntR family transcriptional regulator [Paenibacillus psychroresistens]|uniref:GntR family transcriptional regulator n=1 Tax=Paenibacillus psychroresistens TaxID=1778678 RepID=A0A6B8RH21_9BACL|nr:GntR family transcriptional regulator [Paenibacillus psychroresistens]QGQ95197.1 GntR family transcriptional regulator [Paenibacillus psychroresistens]